MLCIFVSHGFTCYVLFTCFVLSIQMHTRILQLDRHNVGSNHVPAMPRLISATRRFLSCHGIGSCHVTAYTCNAQVPVMSQRLIATHKLLSPQVDILPGVRACETNICLVWLVGAVLHVNMVPWYASRPRGAPYRTERLPSCHSSSNARAPCHRHPNRVRPK